jgi:transcriptional regulator with XRE-family HTH domain
MKEIRNALRELRESKHLSISEMALIVKMQYANYVNLEEGRCGEKIPFRVQVILYQVFNLNLKEFNEDFGLYVASLRDKALKKLVGLNV